MDLNTREEVKKATFSQNYYPERKKMIYENLLGTDSRSFYKARKERALKQSMVVLLS